MNYVTKKMFSLSSWK